MGRINLLVKPTNQCNLRCKYCFHEKYGYGKKILEIDKLKKFVDMLTPVYKSINIVWHGGEPLMVPLDFYEEAYDFIDKKDAEFSFSIQTNGTLITPKIVDFFKKRNTNFGLSFDGQDNEYTRSHTSEIIDNIKLLQANQFRPGAILVVTKRNVNQLVEEYNYFDSLGMGVKFNPMFIEGAAESSLDLALDVDQYVAEFINFFKHWATDSKGKINVSPCIELVNLILNNHSSLCTFNSCLGKWLCLDSDARIYPCDRLCDEQYTLGNVDTLSSIGDLFSSKAFINLISKSISRRKECIDSCDYYNNCYSGCNANAILNGSEQYPNGIACYLHKEILKGIKDLVLESALCNDIDSLNPQYAKLLRKTNKSL